MYNIVVWRTIGCALLRILPRHDALPAPLCLWLPGKNFASCFLRESPSLWAAWPQLTAFNVEQLRLQDALRPSCLELQAVAQQS
mmetsp:Transcript_356/g.1019  ORF Transcript_356/g.1019 Transcript_356/m.1019 type:complete len:84 (+) Transcript_356:1437-1688(+)